MWAVKAEKMTRFLHTSKPSGYVIPEIETALSGKKKKSRHQCFAVCQPVKGIVIMVKPWIFQIE